VSARSRSIARNSRPPRRRPAPRRDAGKRDSDRIQWDKLGRIALVAAVFGLCLLYVGPVYNLATTYRNAGEVKAEFHRVQAENERLQRLADRARSEAVLRSEARRQGMIVPGERAYVVNGLSR
jgi:hypothetical protein